MSDARELALENTVTRLEVKAQSLQASNTELVETLRQIKLTEDSYDIENTVLAEIYLIAEQALNTGANDENSQQR